MAEQQMNPVLSPSLFATDVQKLVDFYTGLGFHFQMGVNGPDGKIVMAMVNTPCQRGMIMIEATEKFARPAGEHQYIYSNLPEEADIDEVYQGWKAKGVKIRNDIQTQWWGDRNFCFEDPDGHVWTISKTVKQFDPADAPQGFTMKMPATANAH